MLPIIDFSKIVSSFHMPNLADEDPSPTFIFLRRQIMVANFLPLHCVKDKKTGQWQFTWDRDSLILQMKVGFPSDTEVVYVGSLKVDVDICEQEEVAEILLENFKCFPTFVPPDIQEKFYHGFCKGQLWPLFHYMLPFCHGEAQLFDQGLFQAYFLANKIFADKVVLAMSSDEDYVWVHDYHLMLLPTLLRKQIKHVKLGFFLHSPFPSSEIYRALPVRDQILKGLLNADMVGFQTVDYACHFLSCCGKLIGADFGLKCGYIGIEYLGHITRLMILPVGVHVGRLKELLHLPSTISKVQKIEQKFRGRTLLLGVDDMDTFKGINLKLLAFQNLLQMNDNLRGKVVLVQIANPPRTRNGMKEARKEAISIVERINSIYGGPGYEPVVFIDHSIPSYEKIAFYAMADCCIVTAVRDGMNLVPFEYIVCRQANDEIEKVKGSYGTRLCPTSTLILSEFVGCASFLNGAIKVNPWNLQDVADALYNAMNLSHYDRQLRHAEHYRYVCTYDVDYWVRGFAQLLERAGEINRNRSYFCLGIGLNYKVVCLPPDFKELCIDEVVSSYERAKSRAIFLDYDGTIVPQASPSHIPGSKVLSVLTDLSSDPKNTVFIVSGRCRDSLDEWFFPCGHLGIAAEHGCFIRWDRASEWKTFRSSKLYLKWMDIAEPVMEIYVEATDGSYIEWTNSSMVWHYEDADVDFGSCQAKELFDHLRSVLANEPVVVQRGRCVVEVKPQDISKGRTVKKLLDELFTNGKHPELVICIGDDRSDEDMFQTVNKAAAEEAFPAAPKAFSCTVGRKSSNAKYYLDDTTEVLELLKAIANVSKPRTTS